MTNPFDGGDGALGLRSHWLKSGTHVGPRQLGQAVQLFGLMRRLGEWRLP